MYNKLKEWCKFNIPYYIKELKNIWYFITFRWMDFK